MNTVSFADLNLAPEILKALGKSKDEIRRARQLTTEDVQDCLTELFCQRGVPEYVRSDNGPEFTSQKIRAWLNELGTGTLFIEPGSPWENGYIE